MTRQVGTAPAKVARIVEKYVRTVTEPWDRTTLNAETGPAISRRSPSAPNQLDPDSTTHRPWIDTWLEIRNEVLVVKTNHYFFEQHPEAPPHFDPDDSSQTYYVAEWIRIPRTTSSATASPK